MGTNTSKALAQRFSCPQGHTLRPCHRSFGCDICNLSTRGISLFCSVCDFDCCPSHKISGATWNTENSTTVLKQQCPKKLHQLVLSVRGPWLCDMCHAEHPAGEISAHCPTCDYDECVTHRLLQLPIVDGVNEDLIRPSELKAAKMKALLRAVQGYKSASSPQAANTTLLVTEDIPRKIDLTSVRTGGWGIPSDAWTKLNVYDAPYVSINDSAHTDNVYISSCEIQSNISEFIAKCTMTLTFTNNHDRPLEGDVVFPLPEQATVTGYALEIDGELVPASLVESKKAEKVYEAEVKKGVDPGLLQKVAAGGNAFKTRVYPLPPKSTRRLSLTYTQPLDMLNATSGAVSISLGFSKALNVKVSCQVSSSQAPAVDASRCPGVAVRPTTPGTFEVTYVNPKHIQRDATLRIAVPIAQEDQPIILSEISAEGNGVWFAISDVVPPARPLAFEKHRTAIVWDASLSRDEANVSEECALLHSILQQDPSTVVDVYFVRNTVEFVENVGVDSVIPLLANTPNDGSTSFNELEQHLAPRIMSYDRILLFSDGQSTIGNGQCPCIQTAGVPPIYCLTSAPRYNSSQLELYWAGCTGGNVLHLDRMSKDDILKGVSSVAPVVLGVVGDAVDANPQRPRTVPSHRFMVTGRIPSNGIKGDTASVHVGLKCGSTLQKRLYEIPVKNISGTSVIPVLWAQQRISALEVFPDKYGNDILALGRKYGVVTSSTSLLVLETLQQHLEHNIPPHHERAAMAKQYAAAIANFQKDENDRMTKKLQTVKGYWKERKDWHNRTFSGPSPKMKKESMKSSVEGVMRMAECAQALSSPQMERCMAMDAAPMMACRSAAPPQAERRQRSLRNESHDEECEDTIGGGGGGSKSAKATASVKYWTPDTPYLTAIKSHSNTADQYKEYVSQRKEYVKTPAYYFDVGAYFLNPETITPERRSIGIRILSNIAELGLDNSRILRVLGYKLHEAREFALASEIFCRVAEWRPSEPQSYRDLGLTLLEKGWYQQALELLWETVTMEVPQSFAEIEVEALWEIHDCLNRARLAKCDLTLPTSLKDNEEFFLQGDMSLDLRVTMGWDQDNVDIDLHVVEPTGEEAYYGHKLTEIGGLMSRDFTQGYGPESYALKKAWKGTYRFRTNYFASHAPQLTGPTVAILTIHTNFLRSDQRTVCTLIRLNEAKSNGEIGSVEIQ